MTRRQAWGVASLLCVLAVSVNCGTTGFQAPLVRVSKFETVKRVMAGERPETPDAAAEWLTVARADFRNEKVRIDRICVGIAMISGDGYPDACLEIDRVYGEDLVPAGVRMERFIAQWREDGGELDEAATRYFAQRIGEIIPEVEGFLILLQAFQGTDSSVAPTLPDLPVTAHVD